MKKYDFVLFIFISIVSAITIIGLSYIICAIIDTNNRVEEIYDKYIKDQIDTKSGLIEVNGELIDEDDYYQADWERYTPAKDSIE